VSPALTEVDRFPRECLTFADNTLSGERVSFALDKVSAQQSRPQSITVDNGTGFTSKEFDLRALQERRASRLHLIRPVSGKQFNLELQRKAAQRVPGRGLLQPRRCEKQPEANHDAASATPSGHNAVANV
jgi:hypothetical protein